MATGWAFIDTGSTIPLATNTISEDAKTKHVGRSVLNDSSGTELGNAAAPLQVNVAVIGSGTLAKINTVNTVLSVANIASVGAAITVANINTINTILAVANISSVGAAVTVANVNTVGTVATVANISSVGATVTVGGTLAQVTTVGSVGVVASINTLSTLSYLASANIGSVGSLTTVATVNTVSTVSYVASANIGSVGSVTTLATVNTVGTVSFVANANITSVGTVTTVANANITSVGTVTTVATINTVSTLSQFAKTVKNRVLTWAGTNETQMVASVAAKKIKVFAYSLIAWDTGNNTVKFTSAYTGSTCWQVPLGAVQGANLSVALPSFLFASSDTTTALGILLSSGSTATVSLSYWDDDAI